MAKWFNVKGPCIPSKHYMVNIVKRLGAMKKLIDREEYFVINRGRQYGKTTTIVALKDYLAGDYTVISINFQAFGTSNFINEENFCRGFISAITGQFELLGVTRNEPDKEVTTISELGQYIAMICKNRKVVLMIDEVDRASNYRVFLDFLGILRAKYQARGNGTDPTFHSVILVGVYDIKNIKLKMIRAGVYQLGAAEDANDSPWNIAENFNEAMEFLAPEIAGMLTDYEDEHQTGMDIAEVAEEIYAFTSGYPFLVSRICQYIDEKLERNWTRLGVAEAVKLILGSPLPNTLFDDLFKNIRNNQALSNFLYQILMQQKRFEFSIGDEVIEVGLRYSFIRVADHEVKIHNKMFEILISRYFISKERREGKVLIDVPFEAEVVSGEHFNIELFFEKFNAHYQREYAKRDKSFLEREATFLFLFFLQPYLNGKGFYYPQTQANHATGKRLDVVINYGGKEYIVELKVWNGPAYQMKAYEQLIGYMENRGVEEGYLLIFDFRSKKEVKHEWIEVHGKSILEVQV